MLTLPMRIKRRQCEVNITLSVPTTRIDFAWEQIGFLHNITNCSELGLCPRKAQAN